MKEVHILQILEIVLVTILIVFGFINYSKGFTTRAQFIFLVVIAVAIANIILEVLKWK